MDPDGGPVRLVYFSSVSENTHRFVQKLGLPAVRIPLKNGFEGPLLVHEPYVLILPTYGGGKVNGPDADPDSHAGGYVPKQVIAFLNNEHNRSLIRGVIAAGNTNFGAEFCYAGDVVSRKCGVPYLYRFELMGTAADVEAVRAGLADFWADPNAVERDDTCHQRPLLQSR
jgi:protein involved in ribonucleotide reduction